MRVKCINNDTSIAGSGSDAAKLIIGQEYEAELTGQEDRYKINGNIFFMHRFELVKEEKGNNIDELFEQKLIQLKQEL